ncbi:MAG: hypothetical protein QM758_08420 [Armatimonas sp.]
MKTSMREILLGIVVAIFSGIGTMIALTIIFFAALGKQPMADLLFASAIVLAPGMLLTVVTANLPIASSYKRATALGLLLPCIAVCIYFIWA